MWGGGATPPPGTIINLKQKIMRTKTPEQLHNQWKHISGYVRQRGKFMERH